MRAIGIDLGTTWARAAVADDAGPRLVAQIPSVIGLTGTGQWLVGEEAARLGAASPGSAVGSLRRLVGLAAAGDRWPWAVDLEDGPGVALGGQAYPLVYLCAHVLTALRQLAEEATGEAAEGVVLTAPAVFGDAARRLLLDAAALAGFRSAGLVDEAAAAGLAAPASAAGVGLGRAAVVHAGGGMLGAAVVVLREGGLTMLSSVGSFAPCGEVLDERLAGLVARRVQSRHGVDLRRDPTAALRISAAARRAREALSSAEVAEITLPFVGAGEHGALHLVETVSRDHFEEATADVFDAAAATLSEALGRAGGEAVERLFVTGGLHPSPRLSTAFARVAGCEAEVLPEAAACLGAARRASGSAGPVEACAGSRIELRAGGRTIGSIASASRLPTAWRGALPGVERAGEVELIEHLATLEPRSVRLGHDAGTKGRGAEVTVAVDENGCVDVAARPAGVGHGRVPELNPRRMSAERRAALGHQLEGRRAVQRRRRELADLRNDADGLVFTTQRSLDEYGPLLAPGVVAAIEAQVEAVRSAMETDDAERIGQAVQALERGALTISAAARPRGALEGGR